jgi:hypothetical protein
VISTAGALYALSALRRPEVRTLSKVLESPDSNTVLVAVIRSSLRNYWGFGLCPSSDILKTLEDTTFRKPDLFPSSGKAGRYLLCWAR